MTSLVFFRFLFTVHYRSLDCLAHKFVGFNWEIRFINHHRLVNNSVQLDVNDLNLLF